MLVRFVTFEEWERVEALEKARGEAVGRPRAKLTTREAMVEALSTP